MIIAKFIPIELFGNGWIIRGQVGMIVLSVEHRAPQVLGVNAIVDTEFSERVYAVYLVDEGMEIPADARWMGHYYENGSPVLCHAFSKHFKLTK